MMNQFVELCRLAGDEGWCWKQHCVTCGHTHFRYAFAEMAAGRSPRGQGWVVHRSRADYSADLGPLPMRYSHRQREAICNICQQADLASITANTSFPDWLGYLGLVLKHMAGESQAYRHLSMSWARQLHRMVSMDLWLSGGLMSAAEGRSILNLKDLEACERALRWDSQPLSAVS